MGVAATLTPRISSRTLVAQAIKNDFVIFEREAIGDQRFEVAWAAVDLEDALAGAAFEVVVVFFARHFVAGGSVGQFDRREPAFFDAEFERTVDGCEPKTIVVGGCEDLMGVERPAGVFDRLPDCAALAGTSRAHAQNYSGMKCIVT